MEEETVMVCFIWQYATSWKVAGSCPDEVIGPGVYSASNRNEYQELIK
jgi:hypothetical protein